jgi:ATP:corrinoid adenosyltransferase
MDSMRLFAAMVFAVTVTVLTEVKHAYMSGIMAQRGID